ncbi:MAG: MBL fold metallo-hydrolase [Lachnospiraceae bacterium]|nr:MBL fold metallo-hydrolase [Lachnospiraceae bacterium]
MRVCSIASGSSGNCIYIGDKDTNILIDAGISRKRIAEGLSAIGVRPQELDGIFITHEHSDHIQGVSMMVKMFDTPVYATGATLDFIRSKDKKGIISMNHLYEVHPDECIRLKNMDIMPFSMSHDAADPVCYTASASGYKAGVATDLGIYDDYIASHLAGSDILMLEANHDISMLESGKYPYNLKCRILGSKGHLSNEDSGRLLCKLLCKRLKYVFLAHLSKENNYPELAYQAVKCQIWEDLGINELPFQMSVAKRDVPSALINLD